MFRGADTTASSTRTAPVVSEAVPCAFIYIMIRIKPSKSLRHDTQGVQHCAFIQICDKVKSNSGSQCGCKTPPSHAESARRMSVFNEHLTNIQAGTQENRLPSLKKSHSHTRRASLSIPPARVLAACLPLPGTLPAICSGLAGCSGLSGSPVPRLARSTTSWSARQKSPSSRRANSSPGMSCRLQATQRKHSMW